MSETLDFILDALFLDMQDTFRSSIVDHIKVSPTFMNYLKTNEQNKIQCKKADEQPNSIVSEYKAIPLVVDYTLTDNYEVVYRDDFGFGTFVDTKDLSRYKCIEDDERFIVRMNSDRILRNKENNNV